MGSRRAAGKRRPRPAGGGPPRDADSARAQVALAAISLGIIVFGLMCLILSLRGGS